MHCRLIRMCVRMYLTKTPSSVEAHLVMAHLWLSRDIYRPIYIHIHTSRLCTVYQAAE